MQLKTYKRFRSKGYDLTCKICEGPINPGDEVESKTGGEGPKLYHAPCYDAFHLDFDENGTIRNGLGNVIENE
jgi:hypothetical protein